MGLFDSLFGRKLAAPRLEQSILLDGHVVGLAIVDEDRRLAALTGDGDLFRVDARTGAVLARDVAHEGGGIVLAADPPRQRIATGGMDARVQIRGAGVDAIAIEARVEDGAWIEHLAWWRDTLVFSHGKRVSLLDSSGRQRLLGEHASTVAGLSVVADRLAVARFGGVDLFGLGLAIEGPRALEWPSSLVSIAWSPDLRFLAAGCQDESLHFWRMPSQRDSMMGGYATKPRVIAWAPRSDWLATGGGSDVVVWSFAGEGPEGTTPHQLRAHTKTVSALAYSPDGALLVSGGKDGRVCVFRAGTEAEPIARFDVGGTIERLAFSASGALFAAASSTGAVHLYRR